MGTTTLRAVAVGAALVLLAAPAHASESAGSEAEECDVMTMPAGTLATYLDEEIHAPYLEQGNSWSSLTLTTEEGDTEIDDPVYGSPQDAYSPSGGGVIEQITLCQAGGEDSGGDDDEDSGSDDGESTPAAAGEDQDDENAGPAVETDGPLAASGPGVGLVGGGALALAGLGLVGYAALRRRDGHPG